MAYNVFGNPITDETLKGMPEYDGKRIERVDRAHVALMMKNAGSKDFNARTHVEKLKEQLGDGACTLCLVYNATGDAITFYGKKDWYGKIGKAPYPPLILNGQWGAFLHKAGKLSGSNAAVVYQGRNNADRGCDWMLSWSNPLDTLVYNNRVYTEIREAGHFDSTVWGVIDDKSKKFQEYNKDTWGGCVSIMSTGNDTSPIVEAILTLENA